MSSTFFLREFCFVVQSFFKFAEAEWWAMEVKSHAGRVSGASRVSLVQAVRGVVQTRPSWGCIVLVQPSVLPVWKGATLSWVFTPTTVKGSLAEKSAMYFLDWK